MTSRDALLEHHTLVVRDGRIVDVLPNGLAAERYAAAVHVDRREHLLLPGLVNARAQIVPDIAHAGDADSVADAALLGIAAMLRAGTSCFCAIGYFPEQCARIAAAQGMRAVIGIPLSECVSPWAQHPGDYLTRALDFRDELSGHPTLATVFAPQDATAISDAMFGRIAMLANELDAGVVISVHESAAAVEDCVLRHGLRPIERLHALGLLTPALTAATVVHVNEVDMALAQRSGVAITVCPGSSLRGGAGPPPVAGWARTGLRVSVGTGTADSDSAPDLWSELKLIALLARLPDGGDGSGVAAWDALAAVTRGGAAALGLEAEVGTLETGKWADLCCVDLRSPGMVQGVAPTAARLVFGGGRDIVSDVWVSGRHLLDGGAFTRLDWDALVTRITSVPKHPTTGEGR